MEDNDVASVNMSEVAGQTENIDTQIQQNTSTEQNNKSAQDTSVQNSEVADQKPAQDAETNAQFAKVRREAETKAKDAVIAEMYGQQYGIYTYADYQKAIENQRAQEEAQRLGIDPKFYQEFSTMKNQLSSIEREKTLLSQDRMLETDPKTGELYKEWRNDIHSLADQYNVDYDTAFTFLTREKIADIMAKTQITTEQNTIKNLKQNATSSTGALGSEGANHKTGYSALTAAEKKALRDKVLRGENVTEI